MLSYSQFSQTLKNNFINNLMFYWDILDIFFVID